VGYSEIAQLPAKSAIRRTTNARIILPANLQRLLLQNAPAGQPSGHAGEDGGRDHGRDGYDPARMEADIQLVQQYVGQHKSKHDVSSPGDAVQHQEFDRQHGDDLLAQCAQRLPKS